MDTPSSVTHIGKYEVLSELGRGGMGVVYRAEDKNIGREVAIKTLTDATPELRQRFQSEARTGVLNHQNIVTVYDFGEQDGNPYIVMEFLHGESLEKVLRNNTLTIVDKLDIVRQVCNGMGYAHSKGVVHRDIKPANVMVQPDGNAKIVDFGIARLESSSGHTQTGAVIGTFHYISPERLKGHPSDGRADIWAAGIMLYQMLTGVLPFGGEDISALHKVVNEPFPPLGTYLQDYPTGLDMVLDRALAKDPDERYATAEEMAGDLEALNETLKRARVGEMLGQVKMLLEQEKLTSARPLLIDLQRLDPQNFEIRKLLREVQDRLARQQKSEQVRQTLNQAEEAVLGQRYVEALELYKQAARVDPNANGLTEKIEHVRGLKEKVDKIASLQQQARDARHRSDFTAASQLIEQALQLDERNTDLRNEKAGIVQEMQRQAKDGTRRKLKESGKDLLSNRDFTGAIKNLREALDIDPTDVEAQKMFQEATARQEEDRRRKVIDQIVAEIQDSLFRGESDRALQLINRALDRLPAEAQLLRLKGETEKKLQEEHARKLVESTSLKVQELFFSNPQEALSCIQKALDEIPGEERLLALQERVVDQLKKANLEGLRAQYLKHAQTSLDAAQYDQAISTLETAALDCGETPEITYLLEHARTEKLNKERSQAAAAVLEEAHRKLAAEDLEGAIAVLKPAAQQGGTPAIEQLLRQTQERLDEIGRRMEAVIARVQSLSETDPAQALQLLNSQPAAVQQHSQLKAIRAKIEGRAEQQRAIQASIAQANELLNKRDLRGGLEILEAVRNAYGDSPEITAVVTDYKRRQVPIANAMVGESISQARQAILAKKGPLALEELRKSAEVLAVSDANLQADWNRLAQEAAKVSKARLDTTGSVPIIVQSKGLSSMLIGILAAVVLIVAGAVFYVIHTRSNTGGGAAMSFIQLNASPFGEVVSITGSSGNVVLLPAGSHMTPLRVDAVPEGTYTVVFKSSDGSTQQQTCDLAADHMCSATFTTLGDSQIDEILAGQK
ncbi:serine/threonine-protein kinase [Granulicella tundricola]|uniref:non-specific serine/threonine protein kinase n=1 Tax=Granulicella tundricola (strain ATCC BAA-1859 / DSM 23138 / MP5ACTX9) TaxID=1198114 RepID=E8X6J1_GRATM|nr:serine/threonine-protein kinase [Granulicella tundricola]ADW71075.1 serine/threonine protein kinase [Granulicella tundricola MP5ACTX9]